MSTEAATAEPQITFLGDADLNEATTETAGQQPGAPATEPDDQPQQPDTAKEQPAKQEPEVKQPEAPASPEQPKEVPAPVTPPPPAVDAEPGNEPANEPVDYLEKAGLPKEDTFGRKLLEAYKAGDHENFLKVMGTDWDKVPDLDVVKRNLEEKYNALDPVKRDFMVRRELAKYDTSTFDPEEKQAAEIALELEAKQLRDGYKAQQSQYQIPERQPDPEVAGKLAAIEQQQEAVQQEITRLDAHYSADPTIKQFVTDRLVHFGEGEDAFHYEAAPDIDIAADLKNGYLQDFYVKDKAGNPVPDPNSKLGQYLIDTKKYLEVRAAVKDWPGFLKSYADHVRNLERKAYEAELRNPGRREEKAPPSETGKVKFLGDA